MELSLTSKNSFWQCSSKADGRWWTTTATRTRSTSKHQIILLPPRRSIQRQKGLLKATHLFSCNPVFFLLYLIFFQLYFPIYLNFYISVFLYFSIYVNKSSIYVYSFSTEAVWDEALKNDSMWEVEIIYSSALAFFKFYQFVLVVFSIEEALEAFARIVERR